MEFLEATNVFLAVLSLGLCLIFVLILWDLRAKRDSMLYYSAVAILAVNLGDGVRQAVFGYGRSFYPTDPLWTLRGKQFLIIMAALLLTTVGKACMARVFSQDRLGNGPWVLLVGVATVAGIAAFYL